MQSSDKQQTCSRCWQYCGMAPSCSLHTSSASTAKAAILGTPWFCSASIM